MLGNRHLVGTAAEGVVFVLAAFLASASWQLLLAGGGAALGHAVTGPRGRRITGAGVGHGDRGAGRPYDARVTSERAPKHRGEVVLRPARADDAEAGADLQRICWHEAYTGHTDPKILDARLADRDRWIEAWRKQLAAGPPRVVAEEDGILVGFAVVGPSRDADAPVPDELYALYTRQAYWGSGPRRPPAARGACRRERAASLWVLSTNERATALLRPARLPPRRSAPPLRRARRGGDPPAAVRNHRDGRRRSGLA